MKKESNIKVDINKKRYSKPQLKELGALIKITKGGSSSCSDGASNQQSHSCR